MRIVREFKCEMTGDVCLILRDHNGDEMCMLKEDYDNLDKFETIQERIDRLQDYYDDPNNGLNKCFIVQKIKELKQRQLQKVEKKLEKRLYI